MSPRQAVLFGATPRLPNGLRYQPDFLTRDEESTLLEAFATLPFREARFREYFARRRVVHFHAADAAPRSAGGPASRRRGRQAR